MLNKRVRIRTLIFAILCVFTILVVAKTVVEATDIDPGIVVLDPVASLHRESAAVNATGLVTPSNVYTYVTAPPLMPAITATLFTTATDDGYYFLNASNFGIGGYSPSWIYILDGRGKLVYYKQAGNDYAIDFKKLGDGSLAYGTTLSQVQIMNSGYVITDEWKMGTGYFADFHDFLKLDNGHALMLAYDYRTVDMSTVISGGKPDALVAGVVLQELDALRNVVFEWKSWDHFLITDTNNGIDLTAAIVDYVHANALEMDNDGNILMSSRHLNEITKINRTTGQIMWRLGGKNNQFSFVNSSKPFSWQHDIRRMPNGHISIYDDSNGSYSRGVVYDIDEIGKVVTQVQEYRTTPDTFSMAMGNNQFQNNGDRLVGWGLVFTRTRTATLFDPSGDTLKEFALPAGFWSYRVQRYPWSATPAYSPSLVFTKTAGNAKLFFSWNGATSVTSYTVLGGLSDKTPVVIGNVRKTDFENSLALTPQDTGLCFFRVIALDANGSPLGQSEVVRRDAPCPKIHYFPLMFNQ